MFETLFRVTQIPGDKILVSSKLKAFAVNNIVAQIVQFFFECAEKFGEKQKMLLTSFFFFSPNVFKIRQCTVNN